MKSSNRIQLVSTKQPSSYSQHLHPFWKFKSINYEIKCSFPVCISMSLGWIILFWQTWGFQPICVCIINECTVDYKIQTSRLEVGQANVIWQGSGIHPENILFSWQLPQSIQHNFHPHQLVIVYLVSFHKAWMIKCQKNIKTICSLVNCCVRQTYLERKTCNMVSIVWQK